MQVVIWQKPSNTEYAATGTTGSVARCFGNLELWWPLLSVPVCPLGNLKVEPLRHLCWLPTQHMGVPAAYDITDQVNHCRLWPQLVENTSSAKKHVDSWQCHVSPTAGRKGVMDLHNGTTTIFISKTSSKERTSWKNRSTSFSSLLPKSSSPWQDTSTANHTVSEAHLPDFLLVRYVFEVPPGYRNLAETRAVCHQVF